MALEVGKKPRKNALGTRLDVLVFNFQNVIMNRIERRVKIIVCQQVDGPITKSGGGGGGGRLKSRILR